MPRGSVRAKWGGCISSSYQDTSELKYGLPPLHAWACSRCGRKTDNLRVSQQHVDGAEVNLAAV
jgi:hypothetical protein